MTGVVYFVGAGPGDPRLVTVRGAELLARCQAVVLDASVHHEVLERCPASCVRSLADGTAAQHAERLVAVARAGHVAVRLVAGDPMLLREVDEEIRAVRKAGIAFEIVPGVARETAFAAYTGVALGPDRVAIGKSDGAPDAFVIATDGARVAETVRVLGDRGVSGTTPAAIVRAATSPAQTVREGTLATIAEGSSEGPVLLAVGDAIARREPLRWFDTRPLFGKRVLVTRTREQASGAASMLRDRGAEPVVMPTIEIHPPSDPAPMQRAIAALSSYGWVAFTSANGVDRTWREIERQGRDARAFGAAKIAAIGPGTAQALEAHGLRADLVAKEFRGEGLADALLAQMRPKERVLVARAKDAREVLPDTLRAKGHEVDVVPVYETRKPDAASIERLAGLLERGEIDAVTFTSSSTVTNLCDLLGDRAAALLSSAKVASIGPITSETAKKRGLTVDVTADEYTIPGLLAALERAFASSV